MEIVMFCMRCIRCMPVQRIIFGEGTIMIECSECKDIRQIPIADEK